MELTIHELAAHVGMTPRNIREWQTIGVLPPPHRRGRMAFYVDEHLSRIERVKSLRADGFPLDVIRQFLDRSEGLSTEIRALVATVLDPASLSGTKTLTRTALVERLGADAEEPLSQSGLIEVIDDEQVLVKDVATFEYVEKLAAIGLPIDALVPALGAMTQHQVAAVSAFVELYRDVIWQPFVDAGLPAAQWSSIAATSGQMRDLLVGLGIQTLRRATDIVIGEVAVVQATKLDSGD
jgi:DNA-binding transcriptional MerR regulator